VQASEPISNAFSATHKVKFAWELHEGGAQNIVAKIKATWPTVKYDMVIAWNPVFNIMAKEGWLVDVDDLSNVGKMPEQFLFKSAAGRAKVVPVSTASTFWGYNPKLVGEPITKMKDFLRPGLKGKVALWQPTAYACVPYLSMALEFGGNERNIDPAFDFLKELAASGNVSRVINSDVEHVNTMTTGESAVSYGVAGSWRQIKQAIPETVVFSRVPDAKGLKGFLYTEGWAILDGPNVKAAKEFANFFVDPDNNSAYSAAVVEGPANPDAKPLPELKDYVYSKDELNKYTYVPDYDYMLAQSESWVKRFQTQVVPLIKS
jgi:putative spermidine/putrescine transport system substrate-binding protein